MLARDADRLGALRMLKSTLGYILIEKKAETISDADFVSVVQKEVKKRRDSIEQFEKGGRPELAAKEKQEITVLENFLPQQLSPEDLEKLIRDAIVSISQFSSQITHGKGSSFSQGVIHKMRREMIKMLASARNEPRQVEGTV